MDNPEPALESRKAELIRALDDCRRAMEVGADEVASALDLPGQFRASFASSSWQWLVASLAVGLISGFVLSTRGKNSGGLDLGGGQSPLGVRLARTLFRGALESFAIPALRGLVQGKQEKWFWRLLEKSGS